MASTILSPLADTIADFISDIAGLDTDVVGEKWDPGMAGMDSLPRGVVGTPSIRRTDPDGPEPQMGSDGWYMEYPVTLFFDMSEAKFTQEQAVETVEAFIRAVDTDPSLGDPQVVNDAVVIEATPVQILDEKRPMFAYECRLLVDKFVPSP